MGKKAKKKFIKKEAESVLSVSNQNTVSERAGGHKYLPYLIIFLLSFVVYSSSLHLKYAVDDTIVLTENKYTQQGFKGLQKIFTTDAFEGFFGERGAKLVAGGRYRPLSIATLAVEYELFGMSPAISHFINVLLYALTGILLYIVLLQLFPKTKGEKFYITIPFLATILFVTHPIHTEAVANIKGRDEIMVFLFALFTVWSSVYYVKTKKLLPLLLGFVSFFLAFLSKENGITFLAVIPLTLFVFTNAKVKDYLITTLPLILISAVYLYIRSLYTESSVTDTSGEILNNPFINASQIEIYATVFVTLLHYFKLLIFPHPLSHDYYFNQIPIVGFDSPLAIISVIINLAIIGYAIKMILKKDPLAYAILLFYITFSIVSNFFFTVGVTMSERFIYISSLGFCLAIAILLHRSFSKSKTKSLAGAQRNLMIVVGVVVVLYSIKTFTRNFDWYNNFTLFTHDVHISKNSAKLQTAAGGDLIAYSAKKEYKDKREEMLKEAIGHLNRAIEIYPNHSNAWLLLGNAYYNLNKNVDEAVGIYKKAMTLRTGYYDAIYNIGCVLSENNRHNEALSYFQRAVKLRPNIMEANYNLAVTFMENNRFDSSIVYFNKVAALNPRDGSAYFQIGNIYGQRLNNIDQAIVYYLKAISIQPNNESYLENLGVCYGFKNEYQKAKEVFDKLLKINPNNANAYFNLSITLRNLGDNARADEYYRKAVELNPAYGQNQFVPN